jgi:prepilin-type N-terminal cleavage/methylation domain-containing protein
MLKNRGGFTLFEVMITMAVSAAMLVMTVILFNGQQRKTQFAQSVRDLEQTLQDVQNDTATGYFPNSTYVCTATPTGPEISAGSGVQGTNQDCIFLGKAIHFKKNSMEIYPIVGNRRDASLASATFQSSLPATVFDLKSTKNYRYDLELYEIWWNNNVSSHFSDGRLVVFASTPNGTGTAASGDFFNSGTQKINAYTSSPTNAIDEASSS